MKHTKEFYILMAITVVVPVLILLGMWGFNTLLYTASDANLTVNNTVVTFTLVSKSYTQNLSGTHIAGVAYYLNRSELDSMEYGQKYSCNITKQFFFDMNNSLSGCVRL